jgi:hypothetical protein
LAQAGERLTVYWDADFLDVGDRAHVRAAEQGARNRARGTSIAGVIAGSNRHNASTSLSQ